MAKDHIRDYDLTAGNNTDVDGVNIAEGTAPSNINDAIREVMSHEAEQHGDIRGGLTSGGSQGAYTLTSNESLAAYAQSGGLFVFEANHAMPDTATASLNIDAVGAKPIRKNVSVALQQNDIKANQIVIVAYEAATDVFQMLSVTTDTTASLEATTAVVFYQDAAPTGWTIVAGADEHSVALTKGSVAGGSAGGALGGSVNFSTVFGLTATDGFTITATQLPAAFRGGTGNLGYAGGGLVHGTMATVNQGGGAAHAHNIDLQVKHAFCIVATKD